MIPYTIINFDDVTKRCIILVRDNLGGKHELDVSAEGLMNYELGQKHIQDCFPDLNADQRELLMTGISTEQWDIIFRNDDNE